MIYLLSALCLLKTALGSGDRPVGSDRYRGARKGDHRIIQRGGKNVLQKYDEKSKLLAEIILDEDTLVVTSMSPGCDIPVRSSQIEYAVARINDGGSSGCPYYIIKGVTLPERSMLQECMTPDRMFWNRYDYDMQQTRNILSMDRSREDFTTSCPFIHDGRAMIAQYYGAPQYRISWWTWDFEKNRIHHYFKSTYAGELPVLKNDFMFTEERRNKGHFRYSTDSPYAGMRLRIDPIEIDSKVAARLAIVMKSQSSSGGRKSSPERSTRTRASERSAATTIGAQRPPVTAEVMQLREENSRVVKQNAQLTQKVDDLQSKMAQMQQQIEMMMKKLMGK